MSDKLRMIFVFGRETMCPRTEVKVLFSTKIFDKRHLSIFNLNNTEDANQSNKFYCSIVLFIFTPKSMKTLMMSDKFKWKCFVL